MNARVKQTQAGLFVRDDEKIGLLVFSPHTGLLFACHPKDSTQVLKWLQKKSSIAPTSEYEKALGPGWAIPFENAAYPSDHLLPNSAAYDINPYPTYPVVINWLLTGNCALRCQYCYAEDLMRGRCKEPSAEEIKKIAKTILSYRPLAVVLTGGDPLLSQHLKIALSSLYRRTSIVIDTSAFTFDDKHVSLFKKYGAFARISLDSEIPKKNDFIRCPSTTSHVPSKTSISSGEVALAAICTCIDAGIGISVQTVATKFNRSDLEPFGDKLYRLGVHSWRILMVAPSQEHEQEYKVLRGTQDGQDRFEKYIKRQLLSRHENGWNKGMSIQITHSHSPNSVILVSPEGVYLTESKMKPGKIVLDKENPKHPRISAIFKEVDAHAHIARYLSL